MEERPRPELDPSPQKGRPRNFGRRPLIFILAFAIAAAAIFLLLSGFKGRLSTIQPDEALLAPFRSKVAPAQGDYEALAVYFMQGFEQVKTPHESSAVYAGLPSEHGAQVDQLEGFSRMAPLWGAWVASGRPANIAIGRGEQVDVVATFRRGLLAGTDKDAESYWGRINDNDQRIVEASDVALALWLLRDRVWANFSPGEKQRVVAWFQQVNGKAVFDNNWHLFVVFVDAVLEKLAAVDNHAEAVRHYSRVKQFYRGEGWFSDGPNNVFDYYNAWGIHHQLFWLQQVAPEWDKGFIDTAREQFVAKYRLLMTPSGFPILGRSVCYRMAAPEPLIFSQWDEKHVDAAEARRALDTTWQYFVQHGGVKDGNITQGYCRADARILDRYSGPASCLWGLRSLIAALYLPRDAEFWRASGGKLAVERGDFSTEIKSIGWRLKGNPQTGDVTIDRSNGQKSILLQGISADQKVLGAISGTPKRPDNHHAQYDAATYSSQHPFCGCN